MTIAINIDSKIQLKPFSFVAPSKVLSDLISKSISTLDSSPSGTRSFYILGYKGNVYLCGIGSDTYIILLLPNSKSSANGLILYDPKTLLGLIKNRGEMEFSYTESNELCFKLVSGRYSGSMLTQAITENTITMFNTFFCSSSSKNSKVPLSLLALIREGLDLTAVKDVFTKNSLLSYITLDKSNLSISTFDNHHFGLYEIENNHKLNFSIAAPASHFQLIDSLSSLTKESLEFDITTEHLKVLTTEFIVVLPLMQANEKSFTLVRSFLKAIESFNFVTKVDLDKFSAIVDNLITLHSVNTTFSFSYKKGKDKLRVAYQAPSGTASDMVKIPKCSYDSLSVKAEPKMFSDILNLSKMCKNTTISIKKESCIVITGVSKLKAKVTYVCSLV